jgi:hypothetical protein
VTAAAYLVTGSSGTIAGVFPSMPTDGDRDDPWGDDVSREVARASPRAAAGVYGVVPDEEDPGRSGAADPEDDPDGDEEHEVEFVPVRRQLSLAIAGFATLLAAALLFGAQNTGPDARASYAIVIFGVQVLYVLSWTMAMRPPTPLLVAGVALATGAFTDYLAVTGGLAPLIYTALAAVAVVVIGQFIARVDRLRVRDALGSTLLIILGVVAFASLIVLTRKPGGTQVITVCLTVAGFALLVARVTDAVFPRPRIAAQVPRGATGIILGAMLGTLAAGGLGSVLVFPFTPAKGAVLGLIAAGVAVLVDLAVNFTEAGRGVSGDTPTFWLARHLQGPLGAIAAVSAVAYVMTSFV